MTKFVTEEEFNVVKAQQTGIDVRLAVVEEQLASLTSDVADLSERMDRRFDALERRMDERFDQLTAAILQFARR